MSQPESADDAVEQSPDVPVLDDGSESSALSGISELSGTDRAHAYCHLQPRSNTTVQASHTVAAAAAAVGNNSSSNSNSSSNEEDCHFGSSASQQPRTSLSQKKSISSSVQYSQGHYHHPHSALPAKPSSERSSCTASCLEEQRQLPAHRSLVCASDTLSSAPQESRHARESENFASGASKTASLSTSTAPSNFVPSAQAVTDCNCSDQTISSSTPTFALQEVIPSDTVQSRSVKQMYAMDDSKPPACDTMTNQGTELARSVDRHRNTQQDTPTSIGTTAIHVLDDEALKAELSALRRIASTTGDVPPAIHSRFGNIYRSNLENLDSQTLSQNSDSGFCTAPANQEAVCPTPFRGDDIVSAEINGDTHVTSTDSDDELLSPQASAALEVRPGAYRCDQRPYGTLDREQSSFDGDAAIQNMRDGDPSSYYRHVSERLTLAEHSALDNSIDRMGAADSIRDHKPQAHQPTLAPHFGISSTRSSSTSITHESSSQTLNYPSVHQQGSSSPTTNRDRRLSSHSFEAPQSPLSAAPANEYIDSFRSLVNGDDKPILIEATLVEDSGSADEYTQQVRTRSRSGFSSEDLSLTNSLRSGRNSFISHQIATRTVERDIVGPLHSDNESTEQSTARQRSELSGLDPPALPNPSQAAGSIGESSPLDDSHKPSRLRGSLVVVANAVNDKKPCRKSIVFVCIILVLFVALGLSWWMVRGHNTSSDLSTTSNNGMADLSFDDAIAFVPKTICFERNPGAGAGILCSANETKLQGGGVGNVVAMALLSETPTADFCIVNSGAIRDDIREGNFTVADVLTVWPFENRVVAFEMTGDQIVVALEQGFAGVTMLHEKGTLMLDGAYPYAAGLRYDVNMSAPEGNRLMKAEMKLRNGNGNGDLYSGVWEELNLSRRYTVIVNSYIASGRDNYLVFPEIDSSYVTDLDTEVDEMIVQYALKTKLILDPPLSEYSTQRYIPHDAKLSRASFEDR